MKHTLLNAMSIVALCAGATSPSTTMEVSTWNNMTTDAAGDAAQEQAIATHGLKLYALPKTGSQGVMTNASLEPEGVSIPEEYKNYKVIMDNIFVECLAGQNDFARGDAQATQAIDNAVAAGTLRTATALPAGAKVININLPVSKYVHTSTNWPLMTSTFVRNFPAGTPNYSNDPTAALSEKQGLLFYNNGFSDDIMGRYNVYSITDPAVLTPVSRFEVCTFLQDGEPESGMLHVPFHKLGAIDNFFPFESYWNGQPSEEPTYFTYDGGDMYVALHFYTPLTNRIQEGSILPEYYRDGDHFSHMALFENYPEAVRNEIFDRQVARNQEGVGFVYDTNNECVNEIATNYHLSHLSLQSINPSYETNDTEATVSEKYKETDVNATYADAPDDEQHHYGKIIADGMNMERYTLPAFRVDFFTNDVVFHVTDTQGDPISLSTAYTLEEDPAISYTRPTVRVIDMDADIDYGPVEVDENGYAVVGGETGVNASHRFYLMALCETYDMITKDYVTFGENAEENDLVVEVKLDNSGLTGLDSDTLATKAVAAVTYYDLQGRAATQPHDGINIVVTTHTDGAVTTCKVVK